MAYRISFFNKNTTIKKTEKHQQWAHLLGLSSASCAKITEETMKYLKIEYLIKVNQGKKAAPEELFRKIEPLNLAQRQGLDHGLSLEQVSSRPFNIRFLQTLKQVCAQKNITTKEGFEQYANLSHEKLRMIHSGWDEDEVSRAPMKLHGFFKQLNKLAIEPSKEALQNILSTLTS